MSKLTKLCRVLRAKAGFFGPGLGFGLKMHICRCQNLHFFKSGQVEPAGQATDDQV